MVTSFAEREALPEEDWLGVGAGCVDEFCAAWASSYSIDFTWVIGIWRVVLSSPAKVISEGDVAVTVPVRVDPSRIRIVACCPAPCFPEHAARSRRMQSAALAKMIRPI